MGTIFDTAKYILQKKGRLSTMKLQKLCYYAQAWSRVWDDAPLFEEVFEAWANGPVCPELFQFSQGEFSVDAAQMGGDAENLSSGQKETVDKVIEYYGGRDAQWLSQLTHMESPWQEARQGIPVGARCDRIITKESISMYYGGL